MTGPEPVRRLGPEPSAGGLTVHEGGRTRREALVQEIADALERGADLHVIGPAWGRLLEDAHAELDRRRRTA